MLPDQIETEHLTLRPFSSDDSSAVFEYWQSDTNWPKFNASVPSNFTEEDATKFTLEMSARDRKNCPNWAIVHSGIVSGVVSLSFEQDHKICVLGYGIHGQLRGRGFSTEAARAVIDAAFGSYDQLQRVRAHTDAENEASMRVLHKVGFMREGTLRKNQFVKGQFRDEAIFGLLRNEWGEPQDDA
jgi:ribosomal-protein-alanine N-acetyltransferase